jgi:hypothetical protein
VFGWTPSRRAALVTDRVASIGRIGRGLGTLGSWKKCQVDWPEPSNLTLLANGTKVLAAVAGRARQVDAVRDR